MSHQRLRDFESVLAASNKVKAGYFSALYLSNSLSYARLGVRLNKHHMPRAVDRNRLRRVVRESFRQHQDQLKGLDIVVLMQSKWTPLENAALRCDLEQLWQRILNRKRTPSA
jgi:ribonuclease P protein component